MTTLYDPEDSYVGRRRNPDDSFGDPLIEMRQWLDSLGEVDEPVCPDPDVHRGLYLAREVTWREPAAVVRAELASRTCAWCGKRKL